MPPTKPINATRIMSAENKNCLINESACGRIDGNPVCSKCGMDERVVYPGQADRENAQSVARHRYEVAHHLMSMQSSRLEIDRLNGVIDGMLQELEEKNSAIDDLKEKNLRLSRALVISDVASKYKDDIKEEFLKRSKNEVSRNALIYGGQFAFSIVLAFLLYGSSWVWIPLIFVVGIVGVAFTELAPLYLLTRLVYPEINYEALLRRRLTTNEEKMESWVWLKETVDLSAESELEVSES